VESGRIPDTPADGERLARVHPPTGRKRVDGRARDEVRTRWGLGSGKPLDLGFERWEGALPSDRGV
jgi:hypothetical protein